MNLASLVTRCNDEMRCRDLTQKDVAQLAGISEATASRVLNGLGGNTSVATLQVLCDALGVCPDDAGESSLESVYLARISDLKIQLRQRDRWIRALAIAFGTLVLLIVFLFLYDVLNPNVGWFHRAAQAALSFVRTAI